MQRSRPQYLPFHLLAGSAGKILSGTSFVHLYNMNTIKLIVLHVENMKIHRVLMTNRKCFFPDHTKKLFPCYKNFVTPETKQNVCAKYSRRQNDHADPRTNYVVNSMQSQLMTSWFDDFDRDYNDRGHYVKHIRSAWWEKSGNSCG